MHAGFHQRLQMLQAVTLVEETGRAIVVALHDALRHARQIEAGQASRSNERATTRVVRASVDAAEDWPIETTDASGK